MPDSNKKGADTREALVLMPLALIAVLIGGFWAWKLASGQFAPVPLISSPGAMVVGTYGNSADHNPIETSLVYNAAQDLHSITYDSLIFSQQGDAATGASGKPPEKIAVFLCGAAAIHPSFFVQVGNRQKQRIEWKNVSEFNDAFSIGSLIFPEHCIFTLIPLPFDPAIGSSDALLTGHSGLSSDKTSGANIIYAWPGVLSLPQAVSIDNSIVVSPLTKGSTYTVVFTNLPNDISNVVTDPELTPGSGGLQITGSLSLGFAELEQPNQFRLSGDLSNTQANGQQDLFIAGALVGVAGAGVIWFLELLAKLFLSLRSSSGTETAEVDIPDPGKVEGDHAERQNRDSETASGLGWPG